VESGTFAPPPAGGVDSVCLDEFACLVLVVLGRWICWDAHPPFWFVNWLCRWTGSEHFWQPGWGLGGYPVVVSPVYLQPCCIAQVVGCVKLYVYEFCTVIQLSAMDV
jgi:hypothetical protein